MKSRVCICRLRALVSAGTSGAACVRHRPRATLMADMERFRPVIRDAQAQRLIPQRLPRSAGRRVEWESNEFTT
jgi:hypothetical protein